jgi:hypothetical protein
MQRGASIAVITVPALENQAAKKINGPSVDMLEL